jgi:hypothetical protein
MRVGRLSSAKVIREKYKGKELLGSFRTSIMGVRGSGVLNWCVGHMHRELLWFKHAITLKPSRSRFPSSQKAFHTSLDFERRILCLPLSIMRHLKVEVA